MKRITSVQNPKVKEWASLNKSKYRESLNSFIVEGEHLVFEAFKAGVIKELIYESSWVNNDIDIPTKYEVTNEVLSKITNTKTPQKVVAICNKIDYKVNSEKQVVMLDGVRDPGNMGTIIRSCDAFGVDLIVLGDGCVDLYNPKVIRSTQGSLFHLPIIKENLLNYIDNFDGTVYGTRLNDATSLNELEVDSKWAVVVGNEGKGVSEEILEVVDKNIYIKMKGQSESLNVGVATSIILYEITK